MGRRNRAASPAPLPGRMIFLTKRSGGSRSLRSLHHRLISVRPPGGNQVLDGVAMLLLVGQSQDVILCPMILEKIPAVNSLSATEKLLLVSELWDDLAAHPTEVPVSREQIAELDRRMEEYRRDPDQVTSWEAIQQRILGRTLGSE